MRYAFLLILLVSVSFGAEEGHHSPLELFWKGFNILLFLGIVYLVGRKYIAEAFNRFFNSIHESVDNAEKELRDAKEELKKAKEELEKAKVRAEESVALAHESAKTEIENAKKHAEEVANRIREKAKETIEIEIKKAKEELAIYGMMKAKEIAKSMLEEAFSKPEVQKKFIDNQLRVLEERKR